MRAGVDSLQIENEAHWHAHTEPMPKASPRLQIAEFNGSDGLARAQHIGQTYCLTNVYLFITLIYVHLLAASQKPINYR